MIPVITPWQQDAWIALDILLVAVLIYQVLVMIRGTRAVPMLVGLVVVAVTFYFARIGELTTLNWVVSHVLPYVVFALIVSALAGEPGQEAWSKCYCWRNALISGEIIGRPWRAPDGGCARGRSSYFAMMRFPTWRSMLKCESARRRAGALCISPRQRHNL